MGVQVGFARVYKGKIGTYADAGTGKCTCKLVATKCGCVCRMCMQNVHTECACNACIRGMHYVHAMCMQYYVHAMCM